MATTHELPPSDEEAATIRAVRAMATKTLTEMLTELEAPPAGNWQNNQRRAKALRVAIDALRPNDQRREQEG